VLAVLDGAQVPLSAVDICSKAEADGRPVWLSTVYRILEAFVKERIVTRITVMDREASLYALAGSKHRHYAVCVRCRKIISMDNCPMDQFSPLLRDKDFRVTGHKLEVYGYCGACDGDK
jgi:Fur family ferric uptake transcriptional regulator